MDGNYHGGYRVIQPRDPALASYRGASSYISVRFARTCTNYQLGTYSFNAAYSMIFGRYLGTANMGYSQSGFLRRDGWPIYHFVEEWKGTGPFQRRIQTQRGVLQDGVNIHKYWVQYSPSGHAGYRPYPCIEMNIDVTWIGCTAFNPFSVWEHPFNLEWMGEAVFRGTDVPGYVNTKTRFSDMQVQESTNYFSAAIPTPLVPGGDPRFDATIPSNREFSVWTAR